MKTSRYTDEAETHAPDGTAFFYNWPARNSGVRLSIPPLGECPIRRPGNGCGSCARPDALSHPACGRPFPFTLGLGAGALDQRGPGPASRDPGR